MPKNTVLEERRAGIALAHGHRAKDRSKRIKEAAIACALIAVTLPLLLMIAITIRIEGPGPVLVRQQRAATGGHRMMLVRFLTSTNASERAWPGASKTTRIGELLRYSRLDRLPQLLNVLRGELALARLLD
jgi:lipopolysaccharide/colanic/teichoic acid biosynthesis glycosyltransferase